jgi:hypothetical protein
MNSSGVLFITKSSDPVTLIIAVKLGVGGFSMGAATALYSGTCFAHGKYGNGNPYPVNLSVAVGLSGWLPCARFVLVCLCAQVSLKLISCG